MFETSKATLRRLHDTRFATRYFVGSGLDIGSGNDPLSQYQEFYPLAGAIYSWDMPQGDAQYVESVPDETFDFVHSSHCLEHMQSPYTALKNWLRILKPGGHLVCVVPDEDLYEQGFWPSRFNPDHKHTLTMYKTQSWSPVSKNLLSLLTELDCEVLKVELLDASHRFTIVQKDQTLSPAAECAIEFILRKPNPGVPHEGS
jgi:SAM-dependent methyltransferase